MPTMFAESLREGVEQLGTAHGDARLRVSISSASRRSSRRDGDLGALARRGRDRLQGRQGPRPQPRRGLPGKRRRASCAASRTSTSSPTLRAAIDREPPAPRCAADPAVRRRRRTPRRTYELLLRMLDEEGDTIGPGSLPVGGDALPDDADDRPLGDRRGASSCCSRRRELLAGRAGVLHHQFLRPVAERRGVRRLRDPQHRDAAASTRRCSASSSPRARRSRNIERCRGADAAAAQARLRRRAGRFRHRPVLARPICARCRSPCSRSTAASCATS